MLNLLFIPDFGRTHWLVTSSRFAREGSGNARDYGSETKTADKAEKLLYYPQLRKGPSPV